MKKNNIPVLVALSAFTVLSLGSCQKEDLKPQNPASAAASHTTKNITYDAGIRSNQGYVPSGTTNMAYYRLYFNTALGQQPVVNYSSFGGDVSTVIGYAAGAATEIFAYKYSGYQMINYNGSVSLIMNGASYFTPVIEEIEMDPTSGYVYALCRNGNAIQIWQIDQYGAAVLMTYSTTNAVFYNPSGNGYKSGSITFVPNGSGGVYLVFCNESTVYASLGIVSWYLSISGTALSSVSAQNKTYTGLPGTSATHINTTYGDGKLYFARDGGALYSLSLTTSNSITYEAPPVNNANDFGYWKNF